MIYETMLLTIGIKAKLPILLLLSICTIETGLNPNSINLNDKPTGSYGICQVKPETAEFMLSRKVLNSELMQPYFNAEVAAKYLKYQYDRYDGDLDAVISAYNAGTFTSKNRKYVLKVKKVMWEYYTKGSL